MQIFLSTLATEVASLLGVDIELSLVVSMPRICFFAVYVSTRIFGNAKNVLLF